MAKLEYEGGEGGKAFDDSVWSGLFDDVMAKMTEATKLMRDGLEVVAIAVVEHHAPRCTFPDAIKRFDLVVQAASAMKPGALADGKFTPTMPVEVLRYEGQPVAKLENWQIHVVTPYFATMPAISMFVEWADPRDPIRVVTVDCRDFGQAIADANKLGTVIVLGEHDRGARDDKPHGDGAPARGAQPVRVPEGSPRRPHVARAHDPRGARRGAFRDGPARLTTPTDANKVHATALLLLPPYQPHDTTKPWMERQRQGAGAEG